MNPRIDVVIPVRDVDDYLGDALESVAVQREVEFGSVVVVDAGSRQPIALPDVDLGDLTVSLIRSETPLTAGGARNLGAAAGSAPWITFLDADDRWGRGSRRALIDACVEGGAALAYGTMIEFHSDEESARRLARSTAAQPARVAGGIVVARSAWQKTGAFDEQLHAGEFVEWFNRFRSSGEQSAAIEALALERRVHLKSTTAGQIGTGRDDYLEVVRRWMNRTSS